jgi:hypothetical protein
MDNRTELIDVAVLEKISSLISQGAEHGFNYIPTTYDDSRGNEYEEAQAKDCLFSAWRHLITALELANFQFLYEEAKKSYEVFKKNPLAYEMGPEDIYLIWPYKIEEFLNVVMTFFESPQSPDRNKILDLKKILGNCETFITNKQIFAWLPCGESDLHDRLENILKCYYPDLERKPAINHPIKKFEPDTGIEVIKTFIEYKYVTNRNDCTRVLDEIYADINGYQHEVFKNILFVINKKSRCFLESEWKSSLKKIKTKMKCDFILLKGSTPTQDDIDLKNQSKTKVTKRKRKAKQNANRYTNK